MVSLSNELGRSFIEYRNAVFLVTMKARASKEKTYNVLHFLATRLAVIRDLRQVIADMPGGNPDNIMMIGSHLDSVPAGPGTFLTFRPLFPALVSSHLPPFSERGVNDNGSGTTANLELALAFSKCYGTQLASYLALTSRARYP